MADPDSAHARDNAAKPTYVLPVMQREGERSRLVVTGRRTDDGDRCTLIAVHDTGGTWALYPHGATQLGVRLAKTDAGPVGLLATAHQRRWRGRTQPVRLAGADPLALGQRTFIQVL